MVGNLLQWHLVNHNSVNELHQGIYKLRYTHMDTIRQPHATTITNPEVFSHYQSLSRKPNTVPALPTTQKHQSRPTSTERKCAEKPAGPTKHATTQAGDASSTAVSLRAQTT